MKENETVHLKPDGGTRFSNKMINSHHINAFLLHTKYQGNSPITRTEVDIAIKYT